MKRILFIAPHRPGRAPSQRFRFEQYLDFLKKEGFSFKVSYLLSAKDDKLFYSKTSIIIKIFLLLKFFIIRSIDIFKARKYDIIFIQREAFFLGPSLFEYLFSKLEAKLIYDFDDSIWLPNISKANKRYNRLKNYNKISKIISYSDLVLAGNQYLADYAKCYNKNVKIIPTTIDIEEYQRIESPRDDKRICIGWSGSVTTIEHFKYAAPFLIKIKEKYGEKVYFKVIGDGLYNNEKLDIKGLSWIKKDEIKELSSFDIGIMPLPDDEWAKGKCGLKGLQYMSLKIPTVMSSVGVNTEIIKDGVNGFLAGTNEEWVEKLSLLIESEELRKLLGTNGHKTVVEKYSFQSQKEFFVNSLNGLFIPHYKEGILRYNQSPSETVLFDNNEIASFSSDKNVVDLRTIKSFGAEWKKFSHFSDNEINKIGKEYFDIVNEKHINGNTVAMDLGCGTGRLTKYLSDKVKFIEAVDPSDAIFAALKLNNAKDNVRITRADVDNIPFQDESFDFIFCVGVLHHVPDMKEGLKKAVKKLKPNSYFLLYLYYNLENTGSLYKISFKAVNFMRKIISVQPIYVKIIICELLAFSIYVPLISITKISKLMFRNKNDKIPLSYYHDKSLRIIRNDTLDRFGTPIEHRSDKQTIESMMREAGLDEIVFSDKKPYWHAIGKKV